MRKRVRYDRKSWRNRWPWKRWFPPLVDVRFCPKCGLPYQNGVMPDPEHKITRGDAGAVFYPAGAFRRNEQVVEFGRWKVINDRWELLPFVSEKDKDDMVEVVSEARAYFAEQKKARR